VPRLLPRIIAPERSELEKINSDEEVYHFSMPLAKDNRAFEAYVSFVAIIAGVALLVFAKSTFNLL
jgi:hypothetical protein